MGALGCVQETPFPRAFARCGCRLQYPALTHWVLFLCPPPLHRRVLVKSSPSQPPHVSWSLSLCHSQCPVPALGMVAVPTSPLPFSLALSLSLQCGLLPSAALCTP